jgi:uncharacterized membrane protein YbhN (UPF0104 family)
LLEKIKKKKLSFWIKSLTFVLALGLLYYILSQNENLDRDYWQELRAGWASHSWLLLAALLLLPFNWGLEAMKWRYLIQKVEKINFWRAYEGVVAGVTMGFVTPHSLGDYAARILCLSSPGRAQGVGAVFLCRISQFYITLYFGSIALLVYVYEVLQTSESDYAILLWFTAFNNILFVLLFVYHKSVLKKAAAWPWFDKLMPYIGIIRQYKMKELYYVLFLSLLRYAVFAIQFVLVLLFFGIKMPVWLLLTGVAFIFLIKSIVPTFLDLGIRETASVLFFGVFGFAHQTIIFASLTLWLLNLVLPAVAGLLLLPRIRLFNKESESDV